MFDFLVCCRSSTQSNYIVRKKNALLCYKCFNCQNWPKPCLVIVKSLANFRPLFVLDSQAYVCFFLSFSRQSVRREGSWDWFFTSIEGLTIFSVISCIFCENLAFLNHTVKKPFWSVNYTQSGILSKSHICVVRYIVSILKTLTILFY